MEFNVSMRVFTTSTMLRIAAPIHVLKCIVLSRPKLLALYKI